MVMDVTLTSLEQSFEQNWDRILANWKDVVSFASIGSNPAHADDCRHCAEWLCDKLSRMGFASEIVETTGQPMVWAERAGKPGKPTVIVYGHYDVQPVEPLDAWTTPPFEPDFRDGRLYGRGAQDNKGQVLALLTAIESLVEADRLDATVKVIIEGEEECGSAGITDALDEWRERLKADILMVADTGTVRSGAPTITMGLRGLALVNATLRTASHDLHSGVHGGVAPNAATEAARLVATLHDDNGRIAIEGFYDGVEEPSATELELAAQTPFDEAGYRSDTGATPVAGETGFSPAERIGFRPALDVNGISSGHAGPGAKTIIPAEADLKLSARLVTGQAPQSCVDAIVRHLEAHVSEGCRLTITYQHAAGPAVRVSPDSPALKTARRALDPLSELPTAFLWEGASIPIISGLVEASGAEPLLVGFGHDDDRIHAPSESFSRAQFLNGYLYAGLFLAGL
jgi:acetylornithine deacetylase/succinyl-diaminopimelate desuccinylase-like protein